MPTLTQHKFSKQDNTMDQHTSFYTPHSIFDKKLFETGKPIDIVYRINREIYKNAKVITSYNRNPIQQQPSEVVAGSVMQVPIDQWKAESESDMIFTHVKGAIIAPVHKFINIPDEDETSVKMIDYFYMTSKRCYNSDTTYKDGELRIGYRDHCCTYLNYFEKYYDTELQLLALYANIKYWIDCEPTYSLDRFYRDLWDNLINPYSTYTSQYLNWCLDRMNMEQYALDLNYKNNKSPVLEYSDYHAKLLLKISVMQNMMIPLLTHFIYKKRIEQSEIRVVLLKAFDMLFQITNKIYGVDLSGKIYETTVSNVNKNILNNDTLWDMQTIRARNSTTHSIETLENIVMQIIPKYTYDKNIIHFNYNAINRDIKYRVTGVPYEYGFVVLSSSNRDEDNNSECDKFEAHAAKINEAIMIQTQVNCSSTMKRIMVKYGPFDEEEIKFYYKELCRNGSFTVNSLQKTLVTYLFAKEFNDPQSVKIVNIRDYIILIIAARRLLESYNMYQLPYIVGGKVNRVVTRKNINKKELQKIENSEYYPLIHRKYNNEKIEKEVILGLIAQILGSEFQIIDYHHPEYNGLPIDVKPDIVSEEVCHFVMLI